VLSFSRFWAIVIKEFLQMRRDRLTLGMIAVLPIIQINLFGYAINSDPRHLKTVVLAAEYSEFTRSLVSGLQQSGYFDPLPGIADEAAAAAALQQGRAHFVISIPADFSQRLVRGETPSILVEADGIDPTATGNAIATLNQLALNVLDRDLHGPLEPLRAHTPFSVQLHRRFNAAGVTQHNIIPGLIGVILSMTMVMMTSLSITRERERNTLENLLSSPVHALEVVCGKMLPYVLVGLAQCSLTLLLARLLFAVPFAGPLALAYAAALLLILANLAVGIAISNLARNQLQAMQMTFFYFLPSVLLSGFMFPFQGMPAWARACGNLLPLTYFNRMIRGILLKGNGWAEAWPHIWPLMLFIAVMMAIGIALYRGTLE